MNIPSGLVTFLFTDIEGSTKLAQKNSGSIQEALKKHNSVLQKVFESNNGFVFKTVGDAFCCSFQNAGDAVKAAVDAQTELNSQERENAVIKIRMGIHSGNIEWNESDYMGYMTLARTARIMSAAYGGQILISEDSYANAVEEIKADISFRDLGNRRLKDLIQPMKLYQVLSSDFPTDFPPLNTLDARPNNLPVQLTSFIGRENEIPAIKGILENSRILTLLGTGGTGKTRLSLQVGADLIDNFENGVYITELASVSDQHLIAKSVMDSIGIKEEPGKSPEETLEIYFKDKELLLILDNCEHLIKESASLAERLLKKCNKLKILATSREALNCSGEQLFRVPPLSVPDPSLYDSPENLSQYTSVRLFIERALSVNQNFRVNNNNAPALSEICFKLDGIPLAIELAAARTKTMTVEKIHERLDNLFSLLTGGRRTALPRQQTLLALIDWSYELLSVNEKKLWSRLSVFNGGWTMESAEEICSDEIIAKEDILDLLSQLVVKSIIIYDEVNMRYKILETIKQYGERKLKETTEEEKFRLKHLDYFVSLTERYESKVSGKDLLMQMETMDAEHSNLISAIEWSVKNKFSERGSRIAVSLGLFWDLRGHYTTGARLIESLLENDHSLSKNMQAKLLLGLGKLIRAQGKYEDSKMYHEKSLSIHRELKNPTGIVTCLQGIGISEAGFGNFEKAQKLFEESLELSRETDFKSGISFALNNLGNVALVKGNFELAEKYTMESLEIKRKSGNKQEIAYSLDTMGNIMTELGNNKQAKMYLEESLELTREIGDKSGISFALNNLAGVAFRNGNLELAQNYFEESLKLRIELGDRAGIAYSMHNLGNIFFNQKKYEQTRDYYQESLKLRMDLRDKLGITMSLISFAALLKHERKLSSAVKILSAAESLAKSISVDVTGNDFLLQKELMKDLHETLGEKDFTKCYAEGKMLMPDEILEFALS